jgi:dTDP-4-dehydrorhamnose reductase
MKKILLTGGNGMLAYDFIRTQCEKFEIVSLDKDNLDITKPREIEKIILEIRPDIILNCAAYTNVDESEDVGMKANFDINTLGTTYLAHAANRYGIDFITISTDYVFDGRKEDGYNENDIQNPINSYGLAKYLGEKLTREAYPNSIIVRTSWLYGGELYGSRKEMGTYKNFVNTMLRLSGNQNELKIIDDQF